MVILNYVIMCLIFGTTFLAIKVGVDAGAPPFFSAGIRFLLAGLVIYLWMIWRKKATLGLLFRKEMLLTGIGLTFGTSSTLYWAEQYISSGMAAVLSATGPLMILILQMMIFKQRTSGVSMLGVILGFAGVVLLVLPSLTVSVSIGWGIGCLAILFGEIFYASGALYSKKVIQQFPQAPPVALNAAQMIYGGLLLLILSCFTEEFRLGVIATPSVVGSLIYLTVVGSMAGHSLFYWLIAKTTPVFPATWLYISPLIAIAIGLLLYDESISWVTALGGITIIAGTMVSNFNNLKRLLRRSEAATSNGIVQNEV